MAYDRYPAVDENNRFPSAVETAAAKTPAMNERFDGIRDLNGIALTTENLDDIKAAGTYSQSASGNATVERNYPADSAAAGRLMVLSNKSQSQVTQMYWGFHTTSPRFHIRSFYNGWGPWMPVSIGDLSTKMDKEATELEAGADANNLTTPGVYYESRTSEIEEGKNFPEITAGVFTVTSNPAREHIHQVFITFGSSNPRQWYRARYNGVWSPWKQIVTDDRMVEAIFEAGTFTPKPLTDEDLNTIKHAGSYSQDFSNVASVDLNYPRAVAGRLMVQTNTTETQVSQMYWTFDTNALMGLYVRNFYNNEWSPWAPIALGDTSKFATKTELAEALEGVSGLDPETIGDRNLNDIKTAGAYSQSSSTIATIALNYPRAVAGRLLVQSNESESQVSQMYWTYDSNQSMAIYARTFYNGTWREWSAFSLGGGGGGGSSDGVYQGSLESGTDVNTLTTPGIYTVATVAIASSLINYPTRRAGVIQVWTNEDTGVTSQDVLAYVSTTQPNERYVRMKLLTSNTSWAPWSSPEWIKGRLGSSAEPIDADTFRTIGAWVVALRGDVTNLPGSGQGLLEVLFTPVTALSVQRFTERVANDEVVVWHRYSALANGWAGVAWSKVGGSSLPSIRESDVQISDHATRVEYEASRRGGSIGTSGVPVFMWRFDHWLVAFRDKILPILEEFDLPATLNVNYDNMDNVQNGSGSITWKDVQDWNQFKGVEIANHGSTHTNAASMEDIFHEVVMGRRNLENAMPLTPVVTWQEHGSAYLVAEDLPGDLGLNLGRSLSAFTESYAGRLVMAEHAVVEGKIGSFYPPMTGRPQIGQSHYSLDRDNETSAIEVIQYAQELGRGMTGYTHPGLMDMVNISGSLYEVTYNEDGSADLAYDVNPHFNTEAELKTYVENLDGIVHMPTKDFREICRWLAIERDAGRLMVMTAAGGGFADKRSDHRENLFVRDSWTASGWTVSGEGPAYSAVSGSTESTLSQGMLMYTRFGWAMGAAHEILVWAKSDVSTTVTISLEANNVPEIVGAWKTEKIFEVPGDGVLHPYRLNCTIPREASGLQMSAKIIGASLTIEGEPLFAAI